MKRAIVGSIVGIVVGVLLLFIVIKNPKQASMPDSKTTGVLPSESHLYKSADEAKKKAPPKFNGSPRGETNRIVTNQNEDGYDAARLIMLTGSSVGAVFESEVRDQSWAPIREKRLTEIMERDLTDVKATSSLVSVECRHSTCKFLFEGPTLEEARWGSLLMQYAMIATVVSPGTPYKTGEKVYSPVFVAFDEAKRDLKKFDEIYKISRFRGFAEMRANPIRPGWPPVPQD